MNAASAFALASACAVALPAPAAAQVELETRSTATMPVEAERDSAFYTLRGERHGVAVFPRVRHPQVVYEPRESLTFDRYHTVDVMYAWLRRWEERFPELVDLYEVGRSFEGRPILQVTLTNEATGEASDKPAAYFEGGRHSGEITSSESVLWLIRHLLEGYGSDPEITALLDDAAIYLRPQNNPDGSNLYLHTAQANRSSVRPHDTDRDGLVDEDPAEDADGDGIIYALRWPKAGPEDDSASYILDPRDPSGQIMARVETGEGEWHVASEGIDNDGDGDINDDGIGGLDLHRNYPENWRPEPGRDATGRGYTQFGAGAYPLSEPETRATVIWLLEHPNVSVANSMDTRVPMHLRPPSTSRSEERMYPEDLRLYESFDSLGLSITDYPWAGDVYYTYMMRDSVDAITGEPSEPGPLFGHGPDFGYFQYGAIWYGDELWNNGAHRDVNGDGYLDDIDALAWDEAENGGRGFREWEPFDHPTLGRVEIGGFHPKFFAQNGPPDVLEEWARKQALFNLAMARHLPKVELGDVTVDRIVAHGDSADYAVTVSWTNTGQLPTALRQAQLVKIVRPDRARLVFDDSLTAPGERRVRILEPAWDDEIEAGRTLPGETKTVRFLVRTYGGEPVEGVVRVLSTRGGEVEEAVRLGG